MNRRDALKALTAMPSVANICVATLQLSDVIVVECDVLLSDETASRIKAMMTEIWPYRKIVVLDRSLKLKVLRSEAC